MAINNNLVLENLSTSNYMEPDKAYSTKVMVNAANNQGITIQFSPITSETILNGLQIRKLY